MRLLRRLTDERGVALPVALAVLMAVAGLATVAARAAIVSNNQSFRDNNAKRAVQAAASGIQAAVYQTNLLQPASNQCVLKNSSTGALTNGAVQSNNWCQPQTENLGDGATWSMQVSSATDTTTSTGLSVSQRTVVSQGTVNGVNRRAAVTINAGRGAPIFPPGFAVVVRESITLMNNATFNGHVGSNGTIQLKNNSHACGDIVAGPGKTASIGKNGTQCAGYTIKSATEPFDLQPVDLSGPRASNDNNRITNMKNGSGTPQDTCARCGSIQWNSTTRVLNLTSNSVLTMTGDTYLFCRLEVGENATVQIPARTSPLRIYIDAPENCPNTTGMGSMKWDGDLVNLYSPPHALLVMVGGSATKPTTIDIPTNDATSPMGIYAPNSTINSKNNLNFFGALVAKSITAMNNNTFTWDPSINGLMSGADIRFYQIATGSYKECTGVPTGATPNTGC